MAKIHTFTDTFPDLSNWSDAGSDITVTAAGTMLFSIDGPSTTGNGVKYSTDNTFDPYDSWLSIQWLNPLDSDYVAGNGFILNFGVVSATFGQLFTTSTHWESGSGELNINDSLSGSHVIPYGGTDPIYIGMRFTTTTVVYGYSEDGVIWNEVGSQPHGLTDPAFSVLIYTNAAATDPGTFTTEIDNLNFNEPDFGGSDVAISYLHEIVDNFNTPPLDTAVWQTGITTGTTSILIEDNYLTFKMPYSDGTDAATLTTLSNPEVRNSWATFKIITPGYTDAEGTYTLWAGTGWDTFEEFTPRPLSVGFTWDPVAELLNIELNPFNDGTLITATWPTPNPRIAFRYGSSSSLFGLVWASDNDVDWTPIASIPVRSWQDIGGYFQRFFFKVTATNTSDPSGDPWDTSSLWDSVYTVRVDDFNVVSAAALPSYLTPIADQDLTPGTIEVSGNTIAQPIPGDFSVTFDPATIKLIGSRIDYSMPPGIPSQAVFPGSITVQGNEIHAILDAYLPGDPFEAPIVISENGTATYDLTGYSLQTGEPAVSGGQDKSIWFRYVAAGPAVVTIAVTCASSFTLAAYDGETLDGLDVIVADVGTSVTVVVDVSTGFSYFRVSTNSADDITVTWSYAVSTSSMFFDFKDTDGLGPGILAVTPDALQVSLQGAAPAEEVRFSFSPPVSDLITGAVPRPITLATIRTDPEGNIFVGTIELPAIYRGTYMLQATGVTSGRIALGIFKVLLNPTVYDATPPPPTAPSFEDRWIWDDGITDPWTMALNPTEVGTTVRAKLFTTERTTAGDGQHKIWGVLEPAISWAFSGTVFSEAELDHLLDFQALGRRFTITDDRNMVHTVAMQSLDVAPKKNYGNEETQTYRATVLLFNSTPGV